MSEIKSEVCSQTREQLQESDHPSYRMERLTLYNNNIHVKIG